MRLTVAPSRLGRRGEGVCEFSDLATALGRAAELSNLHASPLAELPIAQLHIAGLLPGERAWVEVEAVSQQGQRTVAWGRILRRHTAAQSRSLPQCAGYGRCGGCALQHLEATAQQQWKQQRVGAALAAVGTAPLLPADSVAACVPSPSQLGYRSRVKLVVASHDRTPTIQLGAYAPRSHDLIDMAGCRVNLPSLTALSQRVAALASQLGIGCYDESSGSGALRYLLLRECQSGSQQLSIVIADPIPQPQLAALVAALVAAQPQLESVVLHCNSGRGNALLVGEAEPLGEAAADRVLHGQPFVWEQIGQVALRLSARSFTQVNRPVAALIYAAVAGQVPVGARVLDLFCGVGGLGLTVLATVAGTALTGVEANPSAVADAQASAAALGVAESRGRFVCGAAESLLPGLLAAATAEGGGRFDVVLLNPPRRGCEVAMLEALAAAAPPRIIYVSCDPDTLARDLALLCQRGYRLLAATPYDMHPSTPHVETVATLERG